MAGSEEHAPNPANPQYPWQFWIRLAAYAAGCLAIIGVAQLAIFALVTLPVPVAVYWARGRTTECFAFVGAAAGTAAALTGFEISSVTFFGMVSAMGIPLGAGIVQKWSYGVVVAAGTGAGLIALGSMFVLRPGDWQSYLAEYQGSVQKRISLLEEEGDSELAIRQLELIDFMLDNWPYLVFGIGFVVVLVSACGAASLASWWLRRRDSGPAPQGGFSKMRPPEWLVWAVIGVAGLWFWDRQSHTEALRAVSWNGAVGLAGVYMLNGLSIVVYGLSAWKPNPFITILIVFLAFQLQQALIFVGLFDTWIEFRRRIDGIIAARRANEDSS